MIELYVEFTQQLGLGAVGEEVNVDELGDIDWEEDNNDSEEEFEANYEVDGENDDGDLAGNSAMQNEADVIVSQYPFGEGNAPAEDGKFSVGMEFGSRESVISAIKSYTISRGVDYTVYESELRTFYAKCKGYGEGCDWLIRASLIRKKAYAIRPLVEADSSIKVKSVITEVQSRFNYTVSYCKAWLAKQKVIAKVFGEWEVSYQTLSVWLKAMTMKMSRSCVQIKTLFVYHDSEEVQGVRVLHRIFWSFYPCIVTVKHCKPLVQVDGTHLYRKYKGALLVAVAQDGNQNIVPIAFVIIEGETADAWEFFLTNLRRYVVTVDGVGIISDCHISIDAAIARSKDAWSPPRAWHMYCIRHIRSNFLRRFKAPYLHKLAVNTGYSRTEQEYNKNYQRLKKRGEAYTQCCDDISVERWVLAFDGGSSLGTYDDKLGRVHKLCPKGCTQPSCNCHC
ncbi:uncharacterized protein LOC107483967 [Arachis duranensis]|uniref:Uncharacterized protein LOC107483967 n=1 Tax=Arachis duranensis TaxID=130453 RepID=A0A6P4D2V3_ARADU|nr:uncharacterized protein LOC107483967 [Arachis duranensis]